MLDVQKWFLLFTLRTAPLSFDAEDIAACAHFAWESPFGPNDDNSPFIDHVLPNTMAILQPYGNALTLLASDRPSLKLSPPTSFEPPAAKTAWNTWSHSVSIGIAYAYTQDRKRLAALVASLIAAIADQHTLAIYHKATARLWQHSPSLSTQLRTHRVAPSAKLMPSRCDVGH